MGPTDQEMHDRWAELTDNGRNDSRVSTVRSLFSKLRNDLRARYNTPVEILDGLAPIEAKAIAKVKRDIVLSRHWSGFGTARGE